jgi:hydroxymethylglutaryl-CoA reductase
MNGQEVARRIALASRIAQEDEQRAITQNKGIMNGISALVLATMNDTRAVEAAAHAWAGRSGRYRSLSSFTVEEQKLIGAIELPLAVGSLGGAVNFHPASRLALRILGFPGAQRLSRIAAALGLAQNFAAVLALVTGGIQRGHMKYHAARLAFSAGARGEEVRKVADALAEGSSYRMEEAQRLLEQHRREKDG